MTHIATIDVLAAVAALAAVWICGVSGVSAALRGLAVQTLALACITGVIGVERQVPHLLVLSAVVLAVKAIAIPAYLLWATGRLDIRRDQGVLLKPGAAMLAGTAVLTMSYAISPRIAVPELGHVGAAGMALALVLMGMISMMTRRLAISQLTGFLVLENGIFLYSLTQTAGMPLMVEMGVIFDVLIGVMVAGMVIFRLNRSFEHIDVSQLRGLRH